MEPAWSYFYKGQESFTWIHQTYACGTWQICLYNGESCVFGIFLCISMATHVTACGVPVITMKHHIRFGSVGG